jgi:signal transduction histidine kinase
LQAADAVPRGAEWEALLELRVRERTRELQRANEELESLAYAMAHELRAPARHVEAFAALLEDALNPSPREKGWLGHMRQASRRQGKLIEDILGFLRLGAVPIVRERVDVREAVRETIEELTRQRPEVEVLWVVGEMPRVEADAALVRVILRNLMDNALRFAATHPQPRVETGCTLCEGRCVFHVRDNGPGFDPAHAGRLFQPFERLHSGGDGLGIGLAIVNRLIRRHGGEIWAQSAPGHGAAFFFRLEP